ncbi:hypothetical protein PUN28_003350 [Cardiocondyla obscurior]|uniref:Uncharacterized protein n=1 Tax=Cardiocondyla obscurior TaxID=286306 RepID=A0AAW2GMC7_9HYME
MMAVEDALLEKKTRFRRHSAAFLADSIYHICRVQSLLDQTFFDSQLVRVIKGFYDVTLLHRCSEHYVRNNNERREAPINFDVTHIEILLNLFIKAFN